IAEQPEMTRSAPRSDPRKYGGAQSADSLTDARIQVGSAGALQLGLSPRLHGQATQPIRHQEYNLGFGRLLQLPKQIVNLHDWSVPKESADGYRPSLAFALPLSLSWRGWSLL